ncbi:HIT-type domain-containing protein [Balamuthia mandrillaris]
MRGEERGGGEEQLFVTRGTTKPCRVCHKETARYTCPRCNLQYCSLACYKIHGQTCTEAFYRESVVEGLKAQKPSEEDKKRMLETLRRVHERQIEEEEATDDMEQEEEALARFAGLSLQEGVDSSALLESLSEQERREFFRALADGRLGELLELWKPWWEEGGEGGEGGTQGPKIVELSSTFSQEKELSRVEEEEEEEEVWVKEIKAALKPKREPPSVMKDIPPFSSLLKTQPSPLLVNNLVDLIYAYAYVQRLFNGEALDNATEAAHAIWELSLVLSQNKVHPTLPSAVDELLQNSLKPSLSNNPKEFSLAVLKDVVAILFRPSTFVLMALSDMHSIFEHALQECTTINNTEAKAQTLQQARSATTKRGTPGGEKGNVDKQVKRWKIKMEAAKRKIFFFIAWVNDSTKALPPKEKEEERKEDLENDVAAPLWMLHALVEAVRTERSHKEEQSH